ncbi:hypothetical protein [Streptomyces acidiscabies]|uniref:hypothetical protein n=1 Tax=Streptomyces acidiscabies TaxID=42234 RepID=UPI0038F81FF1
MTQSGQGEEPSARPAREGIVLPSDGGEPLLPGMTGAAALPPPPRYDPQPDPAAPVAGQGWTPPPAQPSHPSTQSWPLPPEGGDSPVTYGQGAPAAGYGQQAPYQQPYEPPATYGQSTPLPPMDEGATQYIPPVTDGGYPGQAQNMGGFPGQYPGAGGFQGSEGATQYLPPVVDGPNPAAGAAYSPDGATQYLPPVPAVEEGATQVLPPVIPGALPPEMGGYQGAMPSPGGSEATQVIPPVPAGGGAPAGFENLFRDEPGAATSGGIPPQQGYGQPQQGYSRPPQPTPYGQQQAPAPYAQQPSYDDYDDARDRGSRSRSKVPLIVAAGVALAAVGIGAGALMGSGGNDDKANSTNVAASADPSGGTGTKAGDGAEAQAAALDKLLADSGSSRATVIGAVADVKACDNLDKAATDLRDAAGQRNDLVTRLSALSVDKLPDHTALTDALTKAWHASAAADDHYAAWADQVAGDKKGCRKGQARTTSETAAGNKESGTATQQKAKAAALWNVIAKQYGLTERQPTQL